MLSAEAVKILESMAVEAVGTLAGMEKGPQADILLRQVEAISMAQEALNNGARMDTPLGALIVKESCDPDHPGFFLDLRRPDADDDAPLALVEYSADDGDLPEEESYIITRTWRNVTDEDYSNRIVHEKIEEFFAKEVN